jgi:hypothetical protein
MPPIPKEYPAGSWHKGNGWGGQLARVSRWLDRLMKANSPEDAEDFLYAFFQNAHHLRDWSPGGRTKSEVDSFLDVHLATRICRDVANLTKHRELARHPAQDYEPSILREYVGKSRGWFEDDTRLVVITNHQGNGIVLDAREVARECLRLWCNFLPVCDVVNSIASHFRLTAAEFSQVLSEAEAMSDWAKQVTARTQQGE